MSKPTCQTYPPTNLQSNGALFGGKCLSTGGSQTRMRWAYLSWPVLGWRYTPWIEDVSADQEEYYFCSGVSYISTNDVQCQVQNAEGYGFGDKYRFWCPSPKAPLLGAPWLIQTMGGSFTDTHYDFTCTTDIACNLHVLVGDSKPWISPTTHITHGVVFHHDAELFFRWNVKVQQNETGDVLVHTFHIPCPSDNVTYWLVTRGSVDGKKSPSIGPPFSFLRIPVPIMEVDDATGITTTSAILHGLLSIDQGKPAYVRFRYTKIDPYTDYTPIVGPYSSPQDFQATIDSLTPDTEYKMATMGSHDYGMDRYGWSYPKYFRTLSDVLYEKCLSKDNYAYAVTQGSAMAYSYAFKPETDYVLTKASCRAAYSPYKSPPPYFVWTLHETNPDNSPKGPALFEFQLPTPTDTPPAWTYYTRTFSPISLFAGHTYAFVKTVPSFGFPYNTYRLVNSMTYEDNCIAVGPTMYYQYPLGGSWTYVSSDYVFWYKTFSPTP